MEYDKLLDNELVDLANKGDTEALRVILERYKGLVKSVSRSLFLAGGDSEDLIQEGMMGMLKAIANYNSKSSFKNYAYLCVKSNILSAIRVNNAKKNLPLNNYISLTGFQDDDDGDKKEIMIAKENNPETDYINRESVEELKISIINVLSKFEYKVLSMYLGGSSFEMISLELNKNQKSIENALNRIRRKISKTVNK